MFTVYEGNKKAQYPDCKVDPSWDNASFELFEDAAKYLDKWLGTSLFGIDKFELNVPFIVYGTSFTIKED